MGCLSLSLSQKATYENQETGKARSTWDASELATYGHALIPKASLGKRRGWTGVTQTESCRREPSALIDRSRAGAQIADGSDGKASACNAGEPGSIPQSGRFPWRRKWQLTPVFLPGKFHGWRSLVRLQSLGSQRLRHNWTTSLSLYVQEGTWLSKAVSWVTQNSGWDGSRLSRKTEDNERAASPLPVCPWRLKQAHGLRWLLEAKAPQSIMEVTYLVSACSHLLLG